MDTPQRASEPGPWYRGVTRYQWLVLLIASLGWVFDVFEGQVFVSSMNAAMPKLVAEGTTKEQIAYLNNISLAAFLVGGAVGGVLFGVLADRIGRTRTMNWTIIVYSVFTCLTAFVQNPWQMAVMRFLVALGIGGEWAVASTLVAEAVPERARAKCGAIFHATSVLGTLLAIVAGLWIAGNPPVRWRGAFLIGAAPALLTIWIRLSLREPEHWVAARESAAAGKSRLGTLAELFSPDLWRRTTLGVLLAASGLATFWGVHIYGKELTRDLEQRRIVAERSASGRPDLKTLSADQAESSRIMRAEMAGMLLTTLGGGLGLLAFGPLCESIGRRGAFVLYHLGGLATTLVLFLMLRDASFLVLACALPVFGFLTLGMHAGYAVYFPELFPTRLRGAGAGVCFNVGRLVAAPILVLTGALQARGMPLHEKASWLSLLFLGGVVLMAFAPETKGRELPK